MFLEIHSLEAGAWCFVVH